MVADERRTVTFDSVPDIATPEDLFAVATAMEHEAARRYRQLAARMAEQGEADLAALFRRLETMEAEHESGLGAWALRERLTPPREISFRWDMPEGIADRALADIGGEQALTPWKALALAVHNEERAFAFYVHVAAKTADARVRTYAERMAQEELEHVALLRLERRRAWRDSQHAAPPRLETADDLADWLHARETAAAARHRGLAEAAEAAGAHELAALLARLAEDADPGGSAQAPRPTGDLRTGLRAEARLLGDDYDTLMQVIETGRDEDLVHAAQDAASRIVARLAQVNAASSSA